MNLDEKMINGVCVLYVTGEADLRGVPELQESARKNLDFPEQPLVIDFESTTFVNTPVWAVVVECYQRSSKSNQGFAVSGIGGRVKDSFDIVRLGEFVKQFSTAEEAAGALSPSASSEG